jgi:hypothetical protein
MRMLATLAGVGAAILGLTAVPSVAGATPCGTGLDTTDVTLTISPTTYTASQCNGPYAAPNNPTNETAYVNNNSIFGGGFTYLDGTGDDSNTSLGITFTVTATLTDPGTWTVSWVDASGLPDLPELIDFAVLLKGGTEEAAYLLNDVLLPISPNNGSGTFDISFTNRGGQEPALSHLTLLGRFEGEPTGGPGPGGGPGTDVPEPGTLALLGVSLLGFPLVRRWRRA